MLSYTSSQSVQPDPDAVVVFVDHLAEVHHVTERIRRLEKAIDEAIEQVPESIRAVVSALQALRGVAKVAAVTIVSEVGNFSRFAHPRQLMAYSGAVPSEHSSGAVTKRGGITKTGNDHLRRVLVESAWTYRFLPAVRALQKQGQEGIAPEVLGTARKA